jgi:hypothetical protein
MSKENPIDVVSDGGETARQFNEPSVTPNLPMVLPPPTKKRDKRHWLKPGLLLLVARSPGTAAASYEAIAAKAECRDTVYEALKVLELAGVLTWAHCIARIQVRERDLFGVTTTLDVP